VVIIAIAAVGFFMFARGVLGIDDWVVRQIVAVVETNIEPDIEFESFSYDAPYTVRMEGVSLIAQDGTEVVTANAMNVELAQRPKRGQPIVIKAIALEAPSVFLIAEEQPDGSTGFRGLVPFVEQDPEKERPDDAESTKLSKVLELRNLAITEGRIVYDDGSGRYVELGGVEMNADITEEAGPEGQTLHAVALSFGREPLANVSLNGALDLDDLVMHLDEMTLSVDLSSEEGIRTLPAQLQQLLGDADAKGTLELTASGRVNLTDPKASNAQAALLVRDAFVAQGDRQLPVEAIDINARVVDGRAEITRGDIKTLGGTINISDAFLELAPENRPAQVIVNIAGVKLNRLVRQSASNTGGGSAESGNWQEKDSDLHGKVSGQVVATFALGALPGTLDGKGQLSIREGQLMRLPVLSQLFNAADIVGQLRGDSSYDDELDAEFRLRPEGVAVDDLSISVAVARFRGNGMLHFDGGLNFQMRGGAVEKIPLIGEAIGAATGKLVRYDIKGELGNAKVSIRTAGLGGAADRDILEGDDPDTESTRVNPDVAEPTADAAEPTGSG
jgi:hypothetical protein